jgi:glucan phosphoethanolaminetransferase (alkaline phosphatase superfamily)
MKPVPNWTPGLHSFAAMSEGRPGNLEPRMRASVWRRPANLIVLTTYLLLSSVPFAPVLFGRTIADPWRMIAIEFAVWSAVWAVFKRPAWFHGLLLPAFLILPVEIYLNARHGQSISVNILGIIAETSPREAAEFMGERIWLATGIFLATFAWWTLVWRAAFKTHDLDWRDRSRWVAVTSLVIASCARLYSLEFGVPWAASLAEPTTSQLLAADRAESTDASDSDSEAGDESTSRSWSSILIDADLVGTARVGRTWPFGVFVYGYEYWQERSLLVDLATRNRQFRFHAHPRVPTTVPQVVMLVIGESSRFDRWSLNGHRRLTNPRLTEEAHLVSLSDVVTGVSATRLSVPVLLSRKPATRSLEAGFQETSVLSAFKEAGFRTYWLSNQMSYGLFDTPITGLAREADVVRFINPGGFTADSSFDARLLAPLHATIAEPALKKLIILHTLGSHWNYGHRYPAAFDIWKPSLSGLPNPDYTDVGIKEQLNNSYDNSILYTDWFLSQVIGVLKRNAPVSSLIYVSDHGQLLYDGSCEWIFHGRNTEFEFHVPALVWHSDLYAATYPDKVGRLLENRAAPLSTENIFHSLVDMGDIRYPDERLDWSFLSETLAHHVRYVDSDGWTDYDHASFQGACREVIDKGKPIPRKE